jgi:hypothetical protein
VNPENRDSISVLGELSLWSGPLVVRGWFDRSDGFRLCASRLHAMVDLLEKAPR